MLAIALCLGDHDLIINVADGTTFFMLLYSARLTNQCRPLVGPEGFEPSL
jgi:hypothetical protein